MNDEILNAKLSAIENTRFIHIPGPNPLIIPGESGSWDDGMLEMCDILKDDGKYYLYYHATGAGESYRIGVAVAEGPLGPFVKYGSAPILDITTFGNSSNDRYIACGTILKESTDKYYLFYSLQQRDDPYNYYIGLATASNPLGPWTKYENNPIMKNFGYVGGVTKKDGKYYMFNEYPTRVQAQDYGHISVAVADAPEGPWEPLRDAPVMTVEEWGCWDDAGYSETNVKYDGNLFHMFYGGAKTHEERLLSQESIGYAYSVDGKHFTKYSKNPVAKKEAVAYGAAMAECCFLAEYPYIYVYHTLRYTKPWLDTDKEKFPRAEHIGVEVLSVADKFTVSYPIYSIKKLSQSSVSEGYGKLPLSVENASRFAITVKCTYSESASSPLKLHLLSASSEKSFDTEDLYTFTLPLKRNSTIQKTFSGELCTRFLKVLTENTDTHTEVYDIELSITLKN